MTKRVHTATASEMASAIEHALPRGRMKENLLLAATALGLIFSCAPQAQAGIYTVTSTGDPGSSGMSLRQAVAAANADPNSVILFDSSLVGSTITLTQGEIAVSKPMSIVGPGASKLKVSGNSRLFVMQTNVAGPVTVEGLTLMSTGTGPAILANHSSLVLQDSTLSGNTGKTSGLYAYGSSAKNSYYAHLYNVVASSNNAGIHGETMTFVNIHSRLKSCTISNNVGSAVLAGPSNYLLIEQSFFSANSGYRGGAIFADEAKSITISNSTFVGNSATSDGGALYLRDSPTSIDKSRIAANTAGGNGGGILVGSLATVPSGKLALTNSSVSGNNAYDVGGGIYVKASSGVYIDFSTINDNSLTDFNTLANGGGLALQLVAGPSKILNSTIYDNFAYNSGGGIAIFQAPIGDTTFITNSTIVKNGTFNQFSNGVSGRGTPKILNSIVANNVNSYGQSQDLTGSFTVNYSLIKNASAATISGSYNITNGTDPQLGLLAVNGGPTLTMLPAVGSPVIDAGLVSSQSGTDQRGVPRVAGGRSDIGAVERQNPEVIIFRNGFD